MLRPVERFQFPSGGKLGKTVRALVRAHDSLPFGDSLKVGLLKLLTENGFVQIENPQTPRGPDAN